MACLANTTTCGTGVAANYPIVARATLGSGTTDACLTRGSSCPAERPFPYFRANATGVQATIIECTNAPNPLNGCQLTADFARRVENLDGSLAGCLSSALTTTVCPVAYGFGLAYTDADLNLQACRPSTQTECPFQSSLYNVQMRDASNALVACATINALGSCPGAFPIFARNSLLPPNNRLVQCRAPGAGCPQSAAQAQNFPFFLADGTNIQGCLSPQAGFTSCDSYQTWNGVPVLGNANNPSGCLTPTTTSCFPTTYIGYYDTSDATDPVFMQCRPPLEAGETCATRQVTINNIQYLVNGRDETGAIGACFTSLVPCPDAAPVFTATSWATRNSPFDCMVKDTPSCPTDNLTPRTFALYRGTRTQQPATPAGINGRAPLPVPFLEGCVEKARSGVNDCSNPQYGSATPAATGRLFLAEVWGDTAGTNLVGCVSTGEDTAGNPEPTPCPTSQPFLLQSTVFTGVDSRPHHFLTECRPAGASTTCSGLTGGNTNVASYKVQLKTVDGAVVGCKQLPSSSQARAKRCADNVGLSTTPDIEQGAPYNFIAIFLKRKSDVDPTPEMAECRPLIGGTTETYPRRCTQYGNVGQATVPIIAGGDSYDIAPIGPPASNAVNRLYGCTVPTARCPSATEFGEDSFIPLMQSNKDGATVQACIVDSVLSTEGVCGGDFTVPVSALTSPTAAGPTVADTYGCLRDGSAADACFNMQATGFPFASGTQSAADNIPGSDLTDLVADNTENLLYCASVNLACDTDAPTQIQFGNPSATIGCFDDSEPVCTAWVNRFLPSATCVGTNT